MPKVNPEILQWARKTAGLTLEEATQKLGLRDVRSVSAVNWLIAYETGECDPTRPLLVKMAKQYRRPLLAFYMSHPPQKGNRGQDFRTLPDEYQKRSDALVDTLIRTVQARQSMLRAALEDEDEATPLVFVGSKSVSDGVTAVSESIKNTIGIDIVDFRLQPTTGDAFTFLRSNVELAGIFVLLIGNLGSYHTAIDLETFRGFALADSVAPFIVINDRDSKAAWSFTLIHELAHIWLGQTGVSNTHSEKKIEKFCNDVASEFLLPKTELMQLRIIDNPSFSELKVQITDFAKSRNLSSSMVAYNLFRINAIDKKMWLRLQTAYRNLWNEAKEEQRNKARSKEGGPNYYTVRQHRIGTLVTLVQRMLAGGALTTTKAGMVLGIKPQNVQKLMESNRLASSGQAA